MGKKTMGSPSLNEGNDMQLARVSWSVLTWVKLAFALAAEHRKKKKALPLNITFKVGQQLNAAMWLWSYVIPHALKLHALNWSLGLAPYDPVVGERIQEALSRSLQPPGPPPGDYQDNPGTDK